MKGYTTTTPFKAALFWASLFGIFTSQTVRGNEIYWASHQYGPRGMVTNILEHYQNSPEISRSLEYDSLGRLTYEKTGSYEVSYQYDKLGNRMNQNQPSEAQTYAYNLRNELLQHTANGQTNELTYDLNGSLIGKDSGSEHTIYEWDSRGRLKRVLINHEEVFQAAYSGPMRRQRKTEGSHSKVYRHDGSTAIQEMNETGLVKELVRSDRGTASVGGVLYTADSERTNTYTYNGVGSSVVFSDGEGTVRSVLYDAFGKILEADDGVDTERLANTKELDQSTGLYFHGRRYYDVAIGRYISMDPARDGKNYYVYANNAPLTYIDPTGTLAFIPLLIGLGTGLGIGAGATMWDNPTPPRVSTPGMEASNQPLVQDFNDTLPGLELQLDIAFVLATTFVDSGVQKLPFTIPASIAKPAVELGKKFTSGMEATLRASATWIGRSKFQPPIEMDLSQVFRHAQDGEALGHGSFGEAFKFNDTLTGRQLVAKRYFPLETADSFTTISGGPADPLEAAMVQAFRKEERARNLFNNAYSHSILKDDLGVSFAEVLALDPKHYILVSEFVHGTGFSDPNKSVEAAVEFIFFMAQQNQIARNYLLFMSERTTGSPFTRLDLNPDNYKYLRGKIVFFDP